MPRPKVDPALVKLKCQQRIQRYKTKPAVKERIRIQHKSYKQKKKEQACLRLHHDPLAQLADTITQQEYLHDAAEVSVVPEPTEEHEPIDMGIIIEEDGEILENFAGPLDGEWDAGFDGGFADALEMNENGGFDGEFADELDTDINDGFDGGFQDAPELHMNDDVGDEFSNAPDVHDNGSQSLIAY